MDTLADLLAGQGAFAHVTAQVKKMARFNKLCQRFLPPVLQNQCFVVDFDGERLLLGIVNNTLASVLRFEKADLLKNLKTQPEFKNLGKIDYKIVAPLPLKAAPKAREFKLSPNNAAILKASIDHTNNPALKAALDKFLKHHR